MTTYNTYQEAKIANPESNIYVSISGVFADSDHVSSIALSGVNEGWNECNPADYCMTVEQFLNDGHAFVEGDLMYSSITQEVFTIVKHLEHKGSTAYSIDVANNKMKRNDERFILHAAALEEKPFLQTREEFGHTKTLNFIYDRMVNVHGENSSVDYMHKLKNAIAFVEQSEEPCSAGEKEKPQPRTKVKFEKVEFDFVSEIAMHYEGGNVLFGKRAHDNTKPELCIYGAISMHRHGDNLYRKVETPITTRDLFIDEVEKQLKDIGFDGDWSVACVAAELFDSSKFKLLEQEGE
tara:strand:+ start:429 stop:1310 length:882 start_codon:yes stop_codon:yes gene_type:complete